MDGLVWPLFQAGPGLSSQSPVSSWPHSWPGDRGLDELFWAPGLPALDTLGPSVCPQLLWDTHNAALFSLLHSHPVPGPAGEGDVPAVGRPPSLVSSKTHSRCVAEMGISVLATAWN